MFGVGFFTEQYVAVPIKFGLALIASFIYSPAERVVLVGDGVLNLAIVNLFYFY